MEQPNTDALISWVAGHAIALLIGVVVLYLIYRYAKPLIHRLVVAVLRAHQATLDTGGEPADELRKRAATLEDVLSRLIRVAVLGLLIVLVLSVFDLWSLLAGLGLVLAALTIAGQAIILDYLMGILILVEGQYFNGDWITVDGPNGVIEGEVQEVGLRRTTLRDASGVVHSISNGLIRSVSNTTRVYAAIAVEVPVLHAADLNLAIEVANRVGAEMAAEPEWADRLLEAPRYFSVVSLTFDGAIIRIRGRVVPAAQWAAASELRRRLALALAEARIDSARWDALGAAPAADAAGVTGGQPARPGG